MKAISFNRLLKEQEPLHTTTDVMLKSTFKCGCTTGIIYRGLLLSPMLRCSPGLSTREGTIWHNNNNCKSHNKHSVDFNEISRISYHVDPLHIVTEIKMTNSFEISRQRAFWQISSRDQELVS